MLKYRTVVAIGVLTVVLRPALVAAQETPLSEILVKLIQADIRLAGQPAGSPFPSHDAHFIPGEQEQLVPYLFNQAILSQLTTFPVGSSSGGFSYTFDPSAGVFARNTTSFGPAFAERALTIGRGKASLGGNYQHAGFDSFEGKNLDDGSIKFYLTHEDVGGQFFEGDIIETSLHLRLNTDTVSLFADYGITNRLDVGVALPIISVDMEASVDAEVLRLSTGDVPPTSGIHVFPNGTSQDTISESGSASGIGDLLLRAKYRFYDLPGGGLAAGLDLRLPTGDADNLLGSGVAQTKLLFIASGSYHKFAPHINFGYTFSGESDSPFFSVSDEFSYALGTEFEANPKLTLIADLVGRSLIDNGRLEEQDRTFTYRSAAGVTGSVTKPEFALAPGALNLTILAAGLKYNLMGSLLVSANVLIPLTKSGIRDTVTPVIGVDYAF